MRKIYAGVVLILVCFFGSTTLQAQLKIEKSSRLFSKPVLKSGPSVQGTTSDCDTVNYPISDSWSGTTYIYTYTSDGSLAGFVNGVNANSQKQKANFFDLSATDYTYLTSTFVAFGDASSNINSSLSKKIFFKVYDDIGGKPGTLLATEERTLAQVKEDVDGGFLTQIDFATPIELPASKKFYISVDVSNFLWTPTPGKQDAIWIGGTLPGEDPPGKAWTQEKNNTWVSYSNEYPLEVTLWMFPIVSTSAAGCTALPIKLLSFNAERKSNDVTLSWKISNELNMKQYELERADNNGNFKTVATVKSLNSLKDQSYTVTDKNAFNLAASVQYRLKQVDGDGSVNYSRVVTVKSTAVITDVTFANPFNGSLKLQLNLAASQLVSVSVYDMQGKLVASEKPTMYNASASTIILNSTANLKSGLYVLKLNAGTEQAVYKVVKQ